ncbi:PEP-CTERM sorting domain-containing protein [Phycisphaeraceae bacterium D3-23]
MRRFGLFAGAGLLCLPAFSAGAIDIVIDYTYDINGFFDTGTSDGQAARTTLERAASDFSSLLTDTFSAIVTPPDFVNDLGGGEARYEWDWEATFSHPGLTGNTDVTLSNPTIGADQYIIYAGGESLAGSTLGQGGPGGFSWSAGGSRYPSDVAEIDAITDAFASAVEDRGESSGFASWGGAVTFDTDAGTNWHFGLEDPSGGESDFYSVAVHELAHALGLGTTDEWNGFINGSGRWTGANAVSEYGGTIPLDPPDGGHWAEDTMSNVFGTGTSQEAAMDPNVTTGTRKLMTDLDVAALDDIGWSIDYSFRFLEDSETPDLNGDGFVGAADLDILLANWGSTTGTTATGDANGDGVTNQLDLDIVDANWGEGTPPSSVIPEPGSLAVLAVGGLALLRRRRR